MSAKLMFIHCLSPLHAGTGQGVGAVDLPISRESSTGLPTLPGSSIKGSLRDKAGHMLKPDEVKIIFGPETKEASEHAGALSFGDAQLVCLPTRSIYGTFAWVSSPLLLQRLLRDAAEAGLDPKIKLQDLLVKHHKDVKIVEHDSIIARDKNIYFEDFDLTAQPTKAVTQLAQWMAKLVFPGDEGAQGLFEKRFGLVHDDIMVFLSRYAIDVVTRASIDADTKTVKRGQLWTEENLPTETLLAALIADMPVLAKKLPNQDAFAPLANLTQSAVQFGGHATIGRGRARVVLQGGQR